MVKCYQVDLKVNGGYTLSLAFDAMKKMQQETRLIDESVTLSYGDRVKLTAGFYDDFETFLDLFQAVMWNDMEIIKNHLRNDFPSDIDPMIRKLSVDNICNSLHRERIHLSLEEKEELYELACIKERMK